MKFNKLALAAALAATTVTAAPAAAVEVVFAQLGLTSSGTNFRWVRSATNGNATFYTTSTPGGTSAGSTLMTFSLVGAAVPLFTLANFSLTGSTTASPASVTGGAVDQHITTGSFNITAVSGFVYAPGPNQVVINAGDSLLSGTFSSTSLQGNIGATVATLLGSTAGGSTINFVSPLFSFNPGSELAFTWGLGGVSPSLGVTSTATTVNGFRSTISGTFQSDPAPIFISNIPEPGTWAMMIVGMGLVGFARRRRSVAVAA